MSEAGRALSRALDRPSEWVRRSIYTIVHKPSGTVLWVANGGFFFDGYDSTPPFLGLIERHWLYWKAMKLRARQVAAALEARA